MDSALPKPAYWRIVQSRPLYIVGWMPRVYGKRSGLTELRVGIPTVEILRPVDRQYLDAGVRQPNVLAALTVALAIALTSRCHTPRLRV